MLKEALFAGVLIATPHATYATEAQKATPDAQLSLPLQLRDPQALSRLTREAIACIEQRGLRDAKGNKSLSVPIQGTGEARTEDRIVATLLGTSRQTLKLLYPKREDGTGGRILGDGMTGMAEFPSSSDAPDGVVDTVSVNIQQGSAAPVLYMVPRQLWKEYGIQTFPIQREHEERLGDIAGYCSGV